MTEAEEALLHINPGLRSLAKPIHGLKPHPRNTRLHDEMNLASIARSLELFGQQKPVVIESDGTIIAGHGTVEAARKLGLGMLAVTVFDKSDPKLARAYRIADNQTAALAEWDEELLYSELMGLKDEGIDPEADLFFKDSDLMLMMPEGKGGPSSLADAFGAPPFSVLDARSGYWRERKNDWLALGIKSEVGRGANLLGMSEEVRSGYGKKKPKQEKGTQIAFTEEGLKAAEKEPESEEWSGTSIFDPVLCELLIRWFCPPKGSILDPFAGGSVRGIVASFLGRSYLGIELRKEQVAANRANWAEMAGQSYAALGLRPGEAPRWLEGDSAVVLAAPPELPLSVGSQGTSIAEPSYDFIYSCPPYADLEVYSDEPGDISAMSYEDFIAAYRAIIRGALARLKPGHFAAWVIGEVRDKRTGFYRGFVPDTIRIFEEEGALLYNEAILVTSAGTLPLRARRIFKKRKLGKMHQNVLVFYKPPKPGGKFVMPPLEEAKLDANMPDAEGDEE